MVSQKARIQDLKRRRQALGNVTQSDIAKLLLVTKHSVWRWENGDEPPHEFVIRGWEATMKELEDAKVKEIEGNS